MFKYIPILVLSLSLFAQSTVAESIINPFMDQNQRVMYSSSLGSAVYPLNLGTFKKINGEWLAFGEVAVEGRLDKSTFELKSPYKLESAFSYLQKYFADKQGKLLFACDGLACGSSNAWANVRFGVKQLYGLDASQHYQVWRIQRDEYVAFVSFYLVQRGNRRVYLQLENLFPSDKQLQFAPTAAVIAKELYGKGRVEILGLSFDQGNISLNQKYIKNYAHAFNQQSFRKLKVAAFDSYPGSDEDRLARSEKYAKAVIDALQEEGVHPRRLQWSSDEAPPENLDILDGAVFISLD